MDSENMLTTEGPVKAHLTTMDFWIGLTLTVSSSFFIGCSFIIKKKGLLRLNRNDRLRAGLGGYGYLREWVWWAGLLTMGVGEFANFAAYVFAPASLVTPLGALSIIITAVLSRKFLNESLNILGQLGCVLCIIGTTIIVIHSPQQEEVNSLAELLDYLQEPAFVTYVTIIVIVSLLIVFQWGPKYGRRNICVYLLLCSAVGSLTVMACKGLGLALKETISGSANDFTNWLTYFFFVVVVFCIVVQTNYLNKALDLFNTGIVTAVYYVFFTTLVMTASAILFREWSRLSAINIISNVCGFLVLVCAIFLLNTFKDLDVNLSKINLFQSSSTTTLITKIGKKESCGCQHGSIHQCNYGSNGSDLIRTM